MIPETLDHRLATWEEFDNMSYLEAKTLICGDPRSDKNITEIFADNGITRSLFENGDKGMYEAYVQLWEVENSPLGRALK